MCTNLPGVRSFMSLSLFSFILSLQNMFVKNVLLVTLLFPLTTADFRCLCNYNVELEVYSRMDISSRPIGYMYEFDCKANYGVQHVDGWQAIQFEHKV